MAKINDFEKKRKSHQKIKFVKGIVVIAIVAIAALIIYPMRFSITSQGIGVFLKDMTSFVFDNTGYPIELEFIPRQLLATGSRVSVVSNSGISVFNAAGNEVISERTTKRDPIATAAGPMLLLYSQGGGELMVRSGSMVLYEAVLDDDIYSADISRDGTFAYSTTSVQYKSTITVYDDNLEMIFEWGSADSTIFILSFSEDAEYLAAGSIYLEDGSVCSKIMLFDVVDGKQIYETQLKDELVVGISVADDKSVLAVTDSSVVSLNGNGEVKNSFSFDGSSLSAFDFDDSGGCIIAVGNYNLSHNVDIIKLDSSVKETAKIVSENEVKAIESYGDDLIVFAPNWLVHYSDELVEANMIETYDASHRVLIDDYIYYTTAMQLHRISIKSKEG